MDERKIQTAALIAIYEHLIKEHKFVIELGTEVAALRETVAGLDPTFADVMEQKRKALSGQIAGSMAQNLSSLKNHLELLKQLFSS